MTTPFRMPLVDLKEIARELGASGKQVSVLWQEDESLAFVARGRDHRSEFHINPSDELMYQIVGTMRPCPGGRGSTSHPNVDGREWTFRQQGLCRSYPLANGLPARATGGGAGNETNSLPGGESQSSRRRTIPLAIRISQPEKHRQYTKFMKLKHIRDRLGGR